MPAFRGSPLSALPADYRAWILEAPVLVLDNEGAETSFTDPDASRVKTVPPSRLRGSQRGQRGSEHGSVLIEVAMGVVIVSLLLLGSIDWMLAAKAKQAVEYMAQESARCVVTFGCDVGNLVDSNAAGVGLDRSKLIVTVDHGAATSHVEYQFTPAGPVFPAIVLKANAQAANQISRTTRLGVALLLLAACVALAAYIR